MEQCGQWKYIGFILLQSVVYGLGNPLTKIAFESITPFWCLAVRFTMAFLVFFLFFGKRIVGQLRAVPVRRYLPASLCMAIAYITCNLALQWTTATNVGFLMSLPVIFAPVLAVLILKSRYHLLHLPIQAIVVAGLYLLCSNGSQLSIGKGDLFALVTAIALAAALVFSEKSLQQLDAVTISAAQAGMTAAISLVCALRFDPLSVLPQVQPEAWAVVVYLALFCTCAAYLLQNTALTYLSSATVSMFQCTQPILTALMSFLLLGETLSFGGIAGAALILVCVLAENILALKEQKQLEQIIGSKEDFIQ